MIKNKADKPKIRLVLSVIQLADTINSKYNFFLRACCVTVHRI